MGTAAAQKKKRMRSGLQQPYTFPTPPLQTKRNLPWWCSALPKLYATTLRPMEREDLGRESTEQIDRLRSNLRLTPLGKREMCVGRSKRHDRRRHNKFLASSSSLLQRSWTPNRMGADTSGSWTRKGSNGFKATQEKGAGLLTRTRFLLCAPTSHPSFGWTMSARPKKEENTIPRDCNAIHERNSIRCKGT
ncbi:hypothetical protein B296_00010728 [Ensete ventricosum]|uniref:Uncharacterized protein n=1 Tax=Ensete ventricosum TaxID=4639 RepID=A0A426Z3V0_ENSVE|nr:hypothetical protein B296_00010728 [Ensete ventricosum]